jgi:hypothetical protein
MSADIRTQSIQLQPIFMRTEKLKSDNWKEWKSQITSLLEMNGLDSFIDAGAAAPKAEDPAKLTGEEKKAISRWVAEDRLCFGLIKLTISSEERVHTTGTTTSAALWKNLCDVKEPKGLLGALAARRQLFRLVAEEGTSMADHITTFRRLQDNCAKMGDNIPDGDLALLLITSLPDSWDAFTTSFFGSSYATTTTISLATLITTLSEEAERRRAKANAMESAQRAVGKSSHPKPICTNCKKSGHSIEYCYSEGGGKEGQAPWRKKKEADKDNQKADSANVISELPDVAYILASSFTSGSPRDKWISDSGSSSHICNNRDSFLTFRPDKFDVGGVGQSQSILALGRGDVKLLSTIQGRTRTITLRDVIYCPDAAHNLMSISRLDAVGGSTVYKNGRVTHYTAEGSVLATGMLHRKLYHLDVQVQHKLAQREVSNLTITCTRPHHNPRLFPLYMEEEMPKSGPDSMPSTTHPLACASQHAIWLRKSYTASGLPQTSLF